MRAPSSLAVGRVSGVGRPIVRADGRAVCVCRGMFCTAIAPWRCPQTACARRAARVMRLFGNKPTHCRGVPCGRPLPSRLAGCLGSDGQPSAPTAALFVFVVACFAQRLPLGAVPKQLALAAPQGSCVCSAINRPIVGASLAGALFPRAARTLGGSNRPRLRRRYPDLSRASELGQVSPARSAAAAHSPAHS